MTPETALAQARDEGGGAYLAGLKLTACPYGAGALDGPHGEAMAEAWRAGWMAERDADRLMRGL